MRPRFKIIQIVNQTMWSTMKTLEPAKRVILSLTRSVNERWCNASFSRRAIARMFLLGRVREARLESSDFGLSISTNGATGLPDWHEAASRHVDRTPSQCHGIAFENLPFHSRQSFELQIRQWFGSIKRQAKKRKA